MNAIHIPQIANFSPVVERSIAQQELDQQEFEQELDALAFEMDGELMNVGRYFQDEHLTDVSNPIPWGVNVSAMIAYRLNPQFRAQYAHWVMNTVVKRLTERRARLNREANMREED